MKKKLSLVLALILCVYFVSCGSQSTDSIAQEYKNNAKDVQMASGAMMRVTNEDSRVMITGEGVVGCWMEVGQMEVVWTVFEADGTWTRKRVETGQKTWENGTYTVRENKGEYFINMVQDSATVDFRYLVSPSFFSYIK